VHHDYVGNYVQVDNLIGLTIPSLTIIYQKGERPKVLEIRVDPVCFDSEGRWHPMQNDITSVLDLILPKKMIMW